MPRFMASPMPFSSPGREGVPVASSPVENTSVRLSCLSPDGRSVHSLSARNAAVYIETHSLPLAGTVEEEDYVTDVPPVVRTRLPEQLATALARYPAIELLCVDAELSLSSSSQERKLPKLCLYTKRDVFLLELAYYSTAGVSQAEGFVVAVTEPFEEVLLGTSTYTSIVRIRQSPQQYMGYLAMCPPESMAMLTHDSETNETSLALYHGTYGVVTTPFVHGMEQLVDPSERITDFCFCHSNTFSLLSNTTVMLLKGSGDVFFAGPILFQGTVVPRNSFEVTVEYLSNEMQQVEMTSPKWRQLRVAKQYLVDAFPKGSASGHFLTAQARSAAFEWQVQMQGPALVAAESDDFETLATSMEPFASGELVGLAIGHLGGIVEFGMLSPTTLIPRFGLESDYDRNELDNSLIGGAIITRVDLRDEEGDFKEQKMACLNLVRDPIMDSVVHCVTPTHIQSIYTNMPKVVANKLRDQVGGGLAGMFSPPSKRKDLKPRTTAWPCLDVSSSEDQRNSVVGAVVSGDVQLGHVLVSRLSNGSMVAVNLTEARQLQEMEALDENEQDSSRKNSLDKKLQELQGIMPLHEIIEPLSKKVIAGLGRLAKVVGSATPVEAVTPDQLAAAVSIKERCDKGILLPIMEMSEHLKERKKLLAVMYANQMAQLKAVKDVISKLRERNSIIQEKAEVAETNSISLTQRGAAVLQSSSDLMPTITQAEYDYFQELKKLDDKTKKWMNDFEGLKGKVDNLQQSIYDDTMDARLDVLPEYKHELRTLQAFCEQMIPKYKRRLEDSEEKVDLLADAAGIERDSEFE